MTVELNAEQEQIIREQLASGQFHSVDEVLTSAPALLPHRKRSVARMLEFSRKHSVTLPPGETVEGLIRAMRDGGFDYGACE